MQKVVAFLLPHQDDEFGVFFAIEEAARRGARPLCVYLTDGGYGGQDPARRNAESLEVLRRLGVEESDVYFTGTEKRYQDGMLHANLDEASHAIAAILNRHPDIRALYMPAWEGGHQDHDALHLIGTVFAAKNGMFGIARQFGLYRAAENLLGMAMFAPLAENGPVDAVPIPRRDRRRYLRLALSYRSQWKTWAGLFPMLAHAYGKSGKQETQGLSLSRLTERPHAGPLLYEKRERARYDDFRAAADAFLRANLPAGNNR